MRIQAREPSGGPQTVATKLGLEGAAVQLPLTTLLRALDHVLQTHEGLSRGFPIPWEDWPDALDPGSGGLTAGRAARKRWQIESLCAALNLLEPHAGCRIVDFGAGGGHLGLVVARLFPQAHVVLMDRKLMSLARAQERARVLGLSNVSVWCGDLLEFTEPFDIGVGLHFCGLLTDIALGLCLRQGAGYVFSPCCYGKLGGSWNLSPLGEERALADESSAAAEFRTLDYPRSRVFHQAHVGHAEHMRLASCADFGPEREESASVEGAPPRSALMLAVVCPDACMPAWRG
jgi:SAM-dependent methyltransferase